MKMPNLVLIQEMHNLLNSEVCIDGYYTYARPFSCAITRFQRIRLAWLVFTGQADALIWWKQ